MSHALVMHGRVGRCQLSQARIISCRFPLFLMSHTRIHDDHDHQASSTASLMGIDAATPSDERAALLDVEMVSAQYDSTPQLNKGGCSEVHVRSPANISRESLFFTDCSFFHRATLDVPVNGCKKSQVLHTLLSMDTELFLFTVRSPDSRCQHSSSSSSIVLEATFLPG